MPKLLHYRYNCLVQPKYITRAFLVFALLASVLQPAVGARAFSPLPRPSQDEVSAYELIIAMNTLRVSMGLQALIEDPIINAVAQSTAAIMAANQMSWHIGDVGGRLAAAGYGGGGKVWGTENFAVGNMAIDEIMYVWSDASHMIPAVNPAYCHVGAGVAKSSNGLTYYVLQAAYTSNKSCGAYKPPDGFTPNPGDGSSNRPSGISQLIVPVKIASPDADGKIFHVVEAGQSFWSIAIAYRITIKDIETWNNISKDSKLQIGQRLFIPGSNTSGYATPTPVGMVEISAPDRDGKILHTVAAYQTLSTISQAYGIAVETILNLNGIQVDWPLQIGQKLIIQPSQVTPSPTPRPLTAVEKLTPAADGKYYHTVKSGETLSWIADLYEVALGDLMAWNLLNESSIIRPDQNLVLQVTPPATATSTPAPATATATFTLTQPGPTPSMVLTITTFSATPEPEPPVENDRTMMVWLVLGGLGAFGLFLVVFFSRKKAGM